MCINVGTKPLTLQRIKLMVYGQENQLHLIRIKEISENATLFYLAKIYTLKTDRKNISFCFMHS